MQQWIEKIAKNQQGTARNINKCLKIIWCALSLTQYTSHTHEMAFLENKFIDVFKVIRYAKVSLNTIEIHTHEMVCPDMCLK